MTKAYEVLVTYRKPTDRPSVRRTREYDDEALAQEGVEPSSRSLALFCAGMLWVQEEDADEMIVKSVQVLVDGGEEKQK